MLERMRPEPAWQRKATDEKQLCGVSDMALKRWRRLTILVLSAIALCNDLQAAQPPADEKERQRIARWEPQIAEYEAQDAKQAPPQEANLFVGSSSIRLWKLGDSFGDLPVINRGFGGSQLADSVHYADRLILKHRPKVVVVYAGDNDLAGGKSPETVAADFRALVAKIHAALPETRIAYIGVKPSLKRWNLIESVRKTNALIAEQCQMNPRLVFVDIDKPMLNDEGKPRPELYKTDGLHLTPEGYAVWTELVRPHLIPQ
jgi:lysophospholipase L1-like esterase